MTILLSLVSSLAWGVADYLGGKMSRGRPTVLVVLVSQTAGLLVALLVAVAVGTFAAPTGYVPWAVGAGAAGASAVLLFYRALAIGTMGIVAPVAALGVIIPVVIGMVGGAVPSALCIAGIGVAIAGVVITARPADNAAQAQRPGRSILLAVGAAAGFGLLQYAIAGGSQYSTVMTMLVMRCASVPVLALAGVLALRSQQRRQHSVAASFPPRVVALIVVIGIFDVSANLMFAVASVSGALPVVAVLGSLYPAATMLLARTVDHERLSRLQNAGVAAAITGVAMIAAGS
ncbi:DMT family transporter [Mycolicibacterium stellerae]|uniref:DMT family transporter n=1 Tax=Mycolicibacterium stellerae TaxID=2358193 RepID=UPI000F0BA6E3|nr:DMT family transporter [Mycolicibacterium stellerae]